MWGKTCWSAPGRGPPAGLAPAPVAGTYLTNYGPNVLYRNDDGHFTNVAAQAGVEDGFPMIGGSMIVDPDGKVVAEAETEDDELIVHVCDLDDCSFGKKTIFDFARHRRIEHYGIIAEQTGVVEPRE
ncbi:MAG: hypothetical protein IH926_12370 [Proteobacteria bacterium]|nr:hypothetical protein [Pseudomonadota bacterium]